MNYYKNERTGEIVAHDPATNDIFALTPLSVESADKVDTAHTEESHTQPRRKYTKRVQTTVGRQRSVYLEGKSCCGSVGPRHKKDCQQASSPTPRPHNEAFGPDRYKAIRAAMHDREFQSARYSLVNKLLPREVNTAVRSKDYTDYLDIRQQ